MTRTLLIVEDDEAQRSRMAEVAGELGFEVKVATNGIEALSAAVLSAPAIIVLDLFMPHLGGYSVLRELKKEERTAGIPIAVVSAHTEDHHRTKAMELGAAAYLAKPFEPDELRNLIRELVPD